MTEELLRIRWDNVSSELDLLHAFNQLRNENEFLDVSLTCADGANTKFIKAHRVILCAYSNVFKDILCLHSNETHPILYLKGLSFELLEAMVKFMYQGEVYLSQDKLHSFLNNAKELQIKGLIENEDGNNSCQTKNEITKESVGNPITCEQSETVQSNNSCKEDCTTPIEKISKADKAIRDVIAQLANCADNCKDIPSRFTNIKEVTNSGCVQSTKKYHNENRPPLGRYARVDISENHQLDPLDIAEKDTNINEKCFIQEPPTNIEPKTSMSKKIYAPFTDTKHYKSLKPMSPCLLCGKTFRASYIKSHIKSKHCLPCEKPDRASEIKRHIIQKTNRLLKIKEKNNKSLIMNISFAVGDLVWAALRGFPSWPAKIVSPPDELKRPRNQKRCHCVQFFGTHDFGWLRAQDLKPYHLFRDQLNKSSKSYRFLKAIEEIEEVSTSNNLKVYNITSGRIV